MPDLPEYLQTGKSLIDLNKSDLFSSRKIHYIHPVKKIPFFPAFCTIDETHKVYSISNKEIIIDIENRSSKIAYSDTFYVLIRYYYF